MNEGVRRATVDARAAQVIVLNSISPLEKEQAGLVNAFGRCLADDVIAESGYPPFDTAAVDGYAVIASDTAGASRGDPRALSVLTARVSPQKPVTPGTLVPVRSGEPLPNGADAVVPSRSAFRPAGGPQVLVMAQAKPSDYLDHAGSSIPAGSTLLARGTSLGPGELALLAKTGQAAVCVTRRPRVAIITTGANVVDIADKLQAGDARNMSRYWMLGMILAAGCELGRLAHVREGRIGIERNLADCAGCDAILLAVGAGDRHDSALAALAQVGTVRFERIQMEPAPACSFGVLDRTPVFILPAEHVLEAFEAFVRPGLLALLGRADLERLTVNARLQSMLHTDPGACRYERAFTSYSDDGYTSVPIAARDSGLDPWTLPNSLIIVPDNVETARRGSVVDAMLLVD